MPNYRLKMNEGWAMPPSNPYYQMPCYYKGMRVQSLLFRADENRIFELLPEPLEPAPGGICQVDTVHAPFTTAYGEFRVSIVRLQTAFRGVVYSYISHIFETNVTALCAGREIWGAPKILADVTLQQHEGTLVGRTVFDGMEIIVASSRLGVPCAVEDMPATPSLRLKIIPRADAAAPAIKQLITYGPRDVVVRAMTKGSGALRFGCTALVDLTVLQPKEVIAAYYREQDHTESYGEILFDYLAR